MRLSTRLSFVFTALLLMVLSTATVEAQVARCHSCEIAQKRCAVNCFGREDKNAMRSCLIGCDNAAALCTCDEPATLSAEDYRARFGLQDESGLKAACHSTTPCGSAYGACTNWSNFSSCGDLFCGFVPGCGLCNDWGQCETGGQGEVENLERYRICFNEQSEACTEYQRTNSYGGCGC